MSEVPEPVEGQSAYAAAGVDIEAGDRAVELMKAHVARTQRPEVLGGLEPGTEYVTDGAYLIRADIEKSGASHDH